MVPGEPWAIPQPERHSEMAKALPDTDPLSRHTAASDGGIRLRALRDP